MRILLRPGLVLPLLLSACGSTDTEVGGESGYSAFADELVRLICQSGATCCVDPAFPQSTCELTLTAGFARAPGTYTFDENAADQCLAAVRADRCFVDLPDICSMVAIGLSAPGEACQTSSECAPPGNFPAEAFCDPLVGEAGHCRQAVGAGQACDGTCIASNDCWYTGDTAFRFCYVSQGLYCGASGSCEPLVPSGVSCAHREECASGLACFDDYVCREVLPPGGRCSIDRECSAGNYCADGGVCAPQLPLGATCDSFEACESGSGCAFGDIPAETGYCAPAAYTCFMSENQ